MTSEQDLLEAVIAAPHDDGPRLVFADFLEEHGDPDRAEFIRLQINTPRIPKTIEAKEEIEWVEVMAKGEHYVTSAINGWVTASTHYDPARNVLRVWGTKPNPVIPPLIDREKQLLAANREAWCPSLANCEIMMERGFPSVLRCSKDIFFGRNQTDGRRRCQQCRQTGHMEMVEYGRNEIAADYFPNPSQYRQSFRQFRMCCWLCGGTGFTGGRFWGIIDQRKLVLPLTSIVLTDRMPRRIDRNDRFGDEKFEWVRDESSNQWGHAAIPATVFDYLSLFDNPAYRMAGRAFVSNGYHERRRYIERDDAQADLSRVCLQWYRQRRDLPYSLKHYRQQNPHSPL